MRERAAATERNANPGLYEIRLKGHLDQRWASCFCGMTITLEDKSDTLLTGPVIDQAALHGMLRRVRDLGIPLISVICVGSGQKDEESLKSNGSIQLKL